MEFLQGKIDNLERKILADEARLFDESLSDALLARLENIIARDKVTLRGYFKQAAQLAQQSQQPAPAPQAGQSKCLLF